MEGVIRLAGLALIGVAMSLMFKEKHPAVSVAVVICAVLAILSFTAGAGIKETVDAIVNIASGSELSGYVKTLMKALGVAYVTSLSHSVCITAGEGTLGEAVLISGKVQLIVLSLPLVEAILDLAGELI